MSLANKAVSALLRSPLHRLLSSSTDLIRYKGRRSGRTITTPTQYTRVGNDVVVLVGRPETKTWWRNFRTECAVDVLLQGRWTTMTAQTVVGADEPERIRPLLNAYLAHFPKASKALGGGTSDNMLSRAVMVSCHPS